MWGADCLRRLWLILDVSPRCLYTVLEAVTRTPASLPFQTDADIQALFMGIDSLCQKYSRETCQVSSTRGLFSVTPVRPPGIGDSLL